MQAYGIQIIAELSGCSRKILNSKTKLESILRKGIKLCRLTSKRIITHQFRPYGLTSIAIISKSHIAIHTYPEVAHASIDIFTCTPNSFLHYSLLGILKDKLLAKESKVIEIVRGKTIHLRDNDIGQRVLLEKKTHYQHLKIVEDQSWGKMLYLDGELQIAESDAHLYNEAMIRPVLKKKKLKSVAILGGGDGGVLHELLKHNPDKVVLVDIDKEVIRCAKKFLGAICGNAFGDSRVEVVIDDASHYLEKRRKFDVVICDLTMNPASLTRERKKDYFEVLFRRIRDGLEKGGVVSVQCAAESDVKTLQTLESVLTRYFERISLMRVFIPSFEVKWVFASARKFD